MSKRIKWLLALLIALGSVVVARAALVEIFYLPLVLSGNPIIPTPKPTSTPNTPCLSLKTTGLCITGIDFNPYTGGPLNESINLRNISSSSVDMEDWRISSDSHGKEFKYTFPAFTIGSNGSVKIWTKQGADDSNDLYMNREEEYWNDITDCAHLMNDADPREKIDSICYHEDEALGLIFYQPPATSP